MMTKSGYCCGMGNLLNMTWSADNLALDFVRESDICHPDLGQILDASCPILYHTLLFSWKIHLAFLWKGRGSTTEGEQDLTMGGSASDL